MLEILIDKNQQERQIALVDNEKLVEYYIDEEKSTRKEGNIYIGVVRNIIKGMQSAFVDIGTEKNSFIHLKDILEKVNEKNEQNNTKNQLNHNEIDISDVIKEGQKILVQVKKDSNLQKGARVSTHINLPSKYIALMPNTDIITISQKIEDKKEQERLIKLVKENLSQGNGAIIRTSAVGKEKEIIEDIKNTEKRWDNIQKAFKNDTGKMPKLLEKAQSLVEKMIIDLPENSIQKITVNSKREFDKIQNFKNQNNYLENATIELKENEDVLDKYDIKKEILKIENRKIWLKCGGFITIDKTEALTAIDINSGKFTGKKNSSKENTIYKVNQEATVEIAKQLRLRNISGIIVIDYIDMEEEQDRKNIMNLLEKELKKDRSKTQIMGFTKLDLLEMTRKKL